MKFSTMNRERKKVIVTYSLFLVFYLVLFAILEQREAPIRLVMSRIDQLIPFCEYFIVPYLFWFIYLILTAIYFVVFCKDDKEVKKISYSFITGMSIFLCVSLFFPNGHMLRPSLYGDGIFISCVKFLYSIDTATNVFPSMHVFCSVAAAIALLRQNELTKKRGFKLAIEITTILIVLSTCFLKQHSVIDVFGALLLNGICYCVFYKTDII